MAKRKRRHSEITRETIDLTGDVDDVVVERGAMPTVNQTASVNGHDGERDLEDYGPQDDEDGESFVDNIVDTAELEPWSPDS